MEEVCRHTTRVVRAVVETAEAAAVPFEVPRPLHQTTTATASTSKLCERDHGDGSDRSSAEVIDCRNGTVRNKKQLHLHTRCAADGVTGALRTMLHLLHKGDEGSSIDLWKPPALLAIALPKHVNVKDDTIVGSGADFFHDIEKNTAISKQLNAYCASYIAVCDNSNHDISRTQTNASAKTKHIGIISDMTEKIKTMIIARLLTRS